MTGYALTALVFCAVAAVGAVFLGVVDFSRPRVQDNYWMSFAAPVLIVVGFAGALGSIAAGLVSQ